MRILYWVGAASLLGVAAASVLRFDDAQWTAPSFLFWLVVVAASLCVVSALGVAWMASRFDQAELGVVAAFFFAASVLPLVHGLTVPGTLYGPNPATMTSVFLAVPVGVLAALSVAVAARPGQASHRWKRQLLISCGITAAIGAALLLEPQTELHPAPGSGLGIAYALATFGGAVWLGVRHVRLAEIAERPAPLVVAIGYLLVGASALVFLGASEWSTYFWIAHAVDIGGVFLATIGALVVYRRHGSIFSVVAPVTMINSRAAFEYGLSPVVHRFVADLEAKDTITRDHVVRTAALAIDVAEELGLGADDVRCCGLVGLLHDVGKLEIPDEILTKPGRLTDDEFEIMRSHTVGGAGLIAGSPLLAELASAVRGHHERLDGRGYPDRLAGTDIPIVARVVSACDAYDAMAFTRHYRVGMDAAQVRSILVEHAGAQWDADVVDALLRVVGERSLADTWALDEVGRRGESGADTIGCDCVPAFAELEST